MKVRVHTVQVDIGCVDCFEPIRSRRASFTDVTPGSEPRAAMAAIAEACAEGWREVRWVSISRGTADLGYAVGFSVTATCPYCADFDAPLFGSERIEEPAR